MYSSRETLISIITVTLNDLAGLERTIASVAGQNYPQVEHVVIDGGSSDGTLELLKYAESNSLKWTSEDDKGIYDAMNKGVKKASGEWVNFQNSGDVFSDSSVISRIVENITFDDDLVYGSTRFIGKESEEIVSAKDVNELWRAMIFNHNSLFVRRDLMMIHPFSLHYKIVADSEFVIWCYKNNYKFKDTGMVINDYLRGGFSDNNSIMRSIERWKLVSDYNLEDRDTINEWYFKRLLWEDFYIEYILRNYDIKI